MKTQDIADNTAFDMLSAMPNVFGMDDLMSAFGMSKNEAASLAEHLEHEGAAVLGGENRWIKLPSPEEMHPAFSQSFRSIGLADDMDRLEALYGNHPRRIEGLKALEYSGVPLMSTLSAASTKEEDSDFVFKKFQILHRHEDAMTLTMHSKQIDEKTWLSNMERCILELVEEMDCSTVMEYVMIAIEDREYSPDKMIKAAEDLDCPNALRKIGSIVKWIPENHYLPDAAHRIAKTASEIPGDWEEISNIIGKNQPPVIEDEEFMVVWRVSPEKVFENTLT